MVTVGLFVPLLGDEVRVGLVVVVGSGTPSEPPIAGAGVGLGGAVVGAAVVGGGVPIGPPGIEAIRWQYAPGPRRSGTQYM